MGRAGIWAMLGCVCVGSILVEDSEGVLSCIGLGAWVRSAGVEAFVKTWASQRSFWCKWIDWWPAMLAVGVIG